MNKPPVQLPDAVRDALQRGNLFDAIKLLRQAGVSNLKEAKAVLEAEARRINAGGGRITWLLVAAAIAAGLIYHFVLRDPG